MDWDKAERRSRHAIIFFIRGFLLFGAVALGLTAGALAYALFSLSHSSFLAPAPTGVLVGISAYGAGLAGREMFTVLYLAPLYDRTTSNTTDPKA